MTPYTHHITDQYLDAYLTEITRDLSESMRGDSITRSIRKGLARSLVRVGAWMLPDKPELVSDTILVLPKQPDDSPVRKAA